jgi:hypothetical protein
LERALHRVSPLDCAPFLNLKRPFSKNGRVNDLSQIHERNSPNEFGSCLQFGCIKILLSADY